MLLIDTYNVLHAEKPAALAGLDEWGLSRRLTARSLSAVLVCDGKEKPGLPPGPVTPGVERVYSGPDRTADDWIAQRAQRQDVVATSDRGLTARVRTKRTSVWTAGDLFHRLLQAAPDQDDPGARDVGRLSQEQTQAWMREMGLED